MDNQEVNHKWINGKLYIFGGTTSNYKEALSIKRQVKRDNIEVKIVRVQPLPVWEYWGHDMDQGFVGNLADAVLYEKPLDKPIPADPKISLTTKGHINAATEMAKAGITEEHFIKLGLCDHCQFGSKPGETYICDKGNFPRADRSRCKYHQERA